MRTGELGRQGCSPWGYSCSPWGYRLGGDPPSPWLTRPPFLLHPLSCGAPHTAELQAFDAVAEWRGPLFRLPITVIKPLDLEGEPGSSSGSGAIVRSDCSVDLGVCVWGGGMGASVWV